VKSVVRKYGIFTAGGVTQSAPQNVHYVFGTPGNGIPSASNLNAQAAYTWDGHTEYLSGGVWYATDVNTEYPIAAETFGNDVAALWNGMPPNSADWLDQSGNGLFGYVVPGGGSVVNQTQAGTQSFSYDVQGDMLSAANTANGSSVASYNYAYDLSGNVTDVTTTLAGVTSDGTPLPIQLASTYDYNGNRTSLAANIDGTALFNNGEFTGFSGGTNDFLNNYDYDALGDMTSVTQATQTGEKYNTVTTKTATFAYDSDSRLIGLGCSDGAGASYTAAFAYDHDSNLTDLTYSTTVDASTVPLAGYHWDYDADGRVTDEYSRNDTSGGAGTNSLYGTWAETSYNYDHDGQLSNNSSGTIAAVSYSNFANPPGTNVSETYDANGNRNSATLPPDITSATGAGNRMLYDGQYYYTYDADGNRTSKYQLSGGIQTNVTHYTWNTAGELTAVNGPNGNATYAYDAFGQMVSETENNTTENYVYDGQDLALVLTADGQVTERELYAAAVDQVLASETVTPGAAGTAQNAGAVSWYATDNQGTVRDVLQYNANSQTTTVVDHVIYDSFGSPTQGVGFSGVPLPRFGLGGMRYDPVTQLYITEHRFYDPATGNWISQDPLGFAAGDTNTSRYCGNSPTNGVDPSGLWTAEIYNIVAQWDQQEGKGYLLIQYRTVPGPLDNWVPGMSWIDVTTPARAKNHFWDVRVRSGLTQAQSNPKGLLEAYRHPETAEGQQVNDVLAVQKALLVGQNNATVTMEGFLAEAAGATLVAGIRVARGGGSGGMGSVPVEAPRTPPARGVNIIPRRSARPGAPMSFDDAVREVRGGGDVMAESRDAARRIAEAAGDGPPVWDPPHGPGQKPHFHPTIGGERAGGHVLY